MDDTTQILVFLLEDGNTHFVERLIQRGADINEAFLNLDAVDVSVLNVLYENGLDIEDNKIIEHLTMIGTEDACDWWLNHPTGFNFKKEPTIVEQEHGYKHNLEPS